MRIAIIYNEPRPAAPGEFEDRSETGVLVQVADIARALCELGEPPLVRGVVSGADLVECLGRDRPQVVFNCCESLHGDAGFEMNVAALFDLLGMAYTGSPPLTLSLALDKGLAKTMLRADGVPTPAAVVVRVAADLPRAARLTYPLIVKPVAEDASIGIDSGAVVYDSEALSARVRFVRDEFEQAALVEELIDGRELNVALLASPTGDLEPLPISEITFDALPAGMPRILSYDAKWATESAVYLATPARCPAPLDAALAERVQTTALSAARAIGVRDYGRVDLRVRASDDAIFVLEVNPNPDLSADAGFMRAARASGRTFAATVEQILSCAVERARARDAATGVS